MKIALTTKEMSYCDRMTIENGVPSAQLMRRVAEKIFFSYKWQGRIYIICGKGNNGGDGLALAEIMWDNGIEAFVFLIEDTVSSDGKYYLSRLKDKGFSNIYSENDCDYHCDIIVDCIFGTGFKGVPDGKYANVIKRINDSKAYKISVDIPSGLNGDNGKSIARVEADETVTVQYPKTGLFLNGGKDATGKLKVIDVGIGLYADGCNIVEEEDIRILFPRRKNDTHKGTYGKSAIIGGCSNYLGAVKLANAGLCALRCGGGLNSIVVPKTHVVNIASAVWESTARGISDKDGFMLFDEKEIDQAMKGVDCVAIGMGIGDKYEENLKIISHILTNYRVKVVIDADGLNSLAKNIDILNQSKADVILTPHIKEMSRLTALSVEAISEDPIKIAMTFAKEYGVKVLLKGASTVVTDGKKVFLIVNGGAELSKGGSGDTLSGVILGMASQGRSLLESGYSAAYLTASAAKNLKDEFSEYGVLPSDVSREIAKIVKSYKK